MRIELRWLGHASWSLRMAEHTLLIDPFLDESPTSPVRSQEVDADYILVTHGHFDHVADVVTIAQRTNAQVIANYEVAEWFRTRFQLSNSFGMNIGGGKVFNFGHVRMTPAWHSSQLPDGSYGGQAAGYLITLNEQRIYFAGDTALFSDMQFVSQPPVDIAVLPVGDLFTMGPDDAIRAIHLIQPRYVLPSHYNTWPDIEQDIETWAECVRRETDSTPIILLPGESYRVTP